MTRPAGEDKVTAGGPKLWRFEVQFHDAQRQIFESKARFKVVAAGRRFGKTVLAASSSIIEAVSIPNATCWWVAPSHDQSRHAQRMVASYIPDSEREINRTLGEIYLSNGSRIAFRSGDRWDNLRGEGLNMVVLDEAAFLSQEVWTQVIRPALADRQGKGLLLSTFDGENWFYDLYKFACDPANEQWEGFRFPTSSNPHIPSAEIEENRRSLPAEVFEQEFEASPRAFVGAVFDGHRIDAATDKWRTLVLPAEPACEAGLDWGHNCTALEVNAELASGDVAWIDERTWHRVELSVRCEEIARLALHYRISTIYADAAGATENVTLAKTLENFGAPTYVQPVPFQTYKGTGILTRQFYQEQGREILSPRVPGLIADTKAYHYERDTDRPAKGNDHTVDAATAFYSSRAYVLADIEHEGVA